MSDQNETNYNNPKFQFGDFTWIVEQIQLEEASSGQTTPSAYVRPFDNDTLSNTKGIYDSSMLTVDINDLIAIIGKFFGSTHVHPNLAPVGGHMQKDRIGSDHLNHILEKTKSTYQKLQFSDPRITHPGQFD